MKLESYIRIFAGSFVLISAIIGFFVGKYWLLITMFVGLNLLQFGFTNFCPLAIVLKRLGVKE